MEEPLVSSEYIFSFHISNNQTLETEKVFILYVEALQKSLCLTPKDPLQFTVLIDG